MLFKVKKNGKVSEEHMNTVSDLTDEITTLMDDVNHNADSVKTNLTKTDEELKEAQKKIESLKNENLSLRKKISQKLVTEESKDIPRPASQQLFPVANPNSQSQQPTTSKIDSQKKQVTEESKDIPRPASQQLFTVANPNSQSQQPTTSKIDSQKVSTVYIQFKPGLTVAKRQKRYCSKKREKN
ncbi:uncharacterized protein LOC143058152 [Mytilus galloprovincialis]|uniref:uncharacterized protein LOC143058152 n=1 Tax=Mytilus galloprovincialis TaxID=29158 RepID=UPI003F7BB24C